MPRTRAHLVLLLGALPVLAAPGRVSAQCPSPTERLLLFPSNGARDVPTNAMVRAEFPAGQRPTGRPTWTVLDDRGGQVAGESSWDGRTATFSPAEDLRPRAPYRARVSVDADHHDFTFNTGTGRDQAAPRFDGLARLSWERRSSDWLLEHCSLVRDGGFVVDFRIPEASDDSPAGELCYYLVQTGGPGLGDERLAATVRRDEEHVRLFLGDEEEGHVCFQVRVRDLAGSFDGNTRERCIDPIADQVFHDACQVVPDASGRRAGAVSLALLLGVALAVGRAGRRR